MRIAIVEPFIGGIGGSQKVVAELADYLVSRGHHVEFFVQKYDSNTPYKQFNRMKINLLRPSSKILSPLVFLFKKIKGFDVVITSNFPSNFACIRNKNSFFICYSPRRYFYDLRDYSFRQAGLIGKIVLLVKILLFKQIDILSARKAKSLVCICRNVQKRVEKYYSIKTSKILYCGIDSDKYKQGKYKNYILSVSRFVDAKRIDLIVRSMKFVKDKNLKLLLVGEGPEEKNLRRLVGNNKKIIFLGKVDENHLKELYSNCLAVVYVPLDEDYGLIPLEAGASGKLTMGVNEGGLKETIINNKTGFLIDKVSPERIAEKIDLIAKDKNLAKKMGRAAKNYSLKFDWKHLLPKWEKEIIAVKNEKRNKNKE